MIRRDQRPDELLESWLHRHRPMGDLADQESEIEHAVSRYIGVMPFLWLPVPDRDDRANIERNSIALLATPTGRIDRPSTNWLGHHAVRTEMRMSGLWNVYHVGDRYEPGFVQTFANLVNSVR
jgi:hypothetical protein